VEENGVGRERETTYSARVLGIGEASWWTVWGTWSVPLVFVLSRRRMQSRRDEKKEVKSTSVSKLVPYFI
jgi:hypothetical protein